MQAYNSKGSNSKLIGKFEVLYYTPNIEAPFWCLDD
jgi:hypothetical protein